MAPGDDRAAKKRRVQKTLSRVMREEDEKNKDRIAELEEALRKKDDDFDAAVDGMDLDADEDVQVPHVKKETEDSDGLTQRVDMVGGEGKEGDKNTEKKKERRNKKKVAIASAEEDSDTDGSGLFLSDHGSTDGSGVESEADSTAISDEEYGKPLFSFPSVRTSEDIKTVGWSNGRSKLFINMHGKKSRARYRLEDTAWPPQYEDELPLKENVSNSNNRPGDERLENGKHKYTKRHVLQIFGVAYKSTGVTVSSSDVESINPETKTDSWRHNLTYVLIAWQVGPNQVAKSWEPRSCLRRIWGTKKADDIIYKAALRAEDRYQEAKTGFKKAYSRSPSRGLAEQDVERERQKSVGGLRSRTPLTHGKNLRSPSSSSPSVAELRETFLANYCELVGVGSFSELPTADKTECIEAWRQEKLRGGVR